MATMKTLNGYGFNATEFNGKAASDYLQKTDTATNSAKLGGKAPEYYINPKNLLDNSDFRNPVNQRGITSETSVPAYSYFLDRWINQTSEARSYGLSTSGITLPLQTTLLQKIEKIEAGKIVTFAIKLSDGTIATLTGTVQYASDGAWMRFASIAHSFGDMYMETMNGVVNVVVYNTKVITIEWAALYEGSYTAETLPPYVPKGYAAELAERQRYYRALGVVRVAGNIIHSDGRVFAYIPCYVPMRKNPSIVTPSRVVVISNVGNKYSTDYDVYYSTSDESINGISLVTTFGSGVWTSNINCTVMIENAALNADL